MQRGHFKHMKSYFFSCSFFRDGRNHQLHVFAPARAAAGVVLLAVFIFLHMDYTDELHFSYLLEQHLVSYAQYLELPQPPMPHCCLHHQHRPHQQEQQLMP